MWQQSLAEFKQVRFLVIYPAISVVMLVLVYLEKTPVYDTLKLPEKSVKIP